MTAIDLLGHIDFFGDYHWSCGPRRFAQWLLSSPLAQKCSVSDYYRHFWHTKNGSVTTIGTSGTQRLGQWSMSAVLTHKLDQWLLLIFWGTYIFSVTTTGCLGHGALLSDYYRNLWHIKVGSVTTIGTSGKQTLGQWLLSELLAHRERFSGHYRHLLLTKAKLLTAIGLFPHIDFFSDYYWSSGARSLVQSLLLALLYTKIGSVTILDTSVKQVSENYRNFWHRENGSVGTVNNFDQQRTDHWLLLVFWHT